MGKLAKTFAVVATALTVTVTGLLPANAMPLPAAPVSSSDNAPIVNVQFREGRVMGDDGARRWDRRWHRGNDRRWDRGHERRWDRREYRSGYYNGYRGYRERRAGYRYYNGYWFPLGAFAAGAIIGGAVAPRAVAPAPGRYSPSHYRWCEQRYKTYRAYDNTYVANSAGQRRVCNSPY